jgi:hypothetical protein
LPRNRRLGLLPAFLAANIVLVVLLVPGAVMQLLAGAVYGMWAGAAVAFIGAWVGACSGACSGAMAGLAGLSALIGLVLHPFSDRVGLHDRPYALLLVAFTLQR